MTNRGLTVKDLASAVDSVSVELCIKLPGGVWNYQFCVALFLQNIVSYCRVSVQVLLSSSLVYAQPDRIGLTRTTHWYSESLYLQGGVCLPHCRPLTSSTELGAYSWREGLLQLLVRCVPIQHYQASFFITNLLPFG